MAQAAPKTETDVANLALSLLRIKQITSIEDDAGNTAVVLRKWFGMVRDATLRKHHWNFAKWFAKIGSVADPVPAFKWDRFFPLPEDCLKVQAVNGCSDDDWEVIGRYIATNASSPIEVTYTRRVEEVAQWDALFVPLVVTELAAACAPELATDERIADRLATASERAEDAAAPPDSGEGSPENLQDSDFAFLRARF